MSDGRVVLLVEDEALIAIYLEDLMKSLGIRFLGPIATMAEALHQARTAQINAAILNWIIEGQPAYAVADALDDRHIPFGFASGVLRGAIDTKWADRPFVTKPYTIEGLQELLSSLLAGSS
jgi:DNA-binding NarL/FixJ family response regulator